MTNIPRLRKRPLEADAAASGRAANEIDIAGCATVSYSSEAPAHPVEHLLDLQFQPPGSHLSTRSADAGLLHNLACLDALGLQREHFAGLGASCRRPPSIFALRRGPCNADALPFQHDLALELRHCRKHIKKIHLRPAEPADEPARGLVGEHDTVVDRQMPNPIGAIVQSHGDGRGTTNLVSFIDAPKAAIGNRVHPDESSARYVIDGERETSGHGARQGPSLQPLRHTQGHVGGTVWRA
jgi:hypothetical protein